jgi:predicted nucleic acid-binding protein
MGHPGSPVSLSTPLVADASLWIALAATGCAAEILAALTRRAVITDITRDELERGRLKGRRTAEVVADLIASAQVEVLTLSAATFEVYSDLVIGEGPDTLDDGEAATLAMACTLGAAAVVDERKARRLAQERFPTLELRCTAELLLSAPVVARLGQARCADAVFAALQVARLRVPFDFLKVVTEAIGMERARQCLSLPAHSRASL